MVLEGNGDDAWQTSKEQIKNKDAKIYAGRSTAVQNPLFCPHTLCMNYVANTFLLVRSSVQSKQTPPWPVPSPDEKGGGLGMGLTPTCKTVDATETNIRKQDVNGTRNEEPQTLGMLMDDSQTQPGADILKPQPYVWTSTKRIK